MPGTYSQILLHVVFSTKERRPWLTEDVSDRLHEYIGGIVRTAKGTLYAIGGTEDHRHLYLRWRTDDAVSDLIRDVKAKSSRRSTGSVQFACRRTSLHPWLQTAEAA